MGLGQVDTMVVHGKCSEGACDGAATASLDQQAFCLKHFLERCYERLEALDPRNRQFRTEAASPAEMRAFIEECSRKALDVSLHSENLSNLERGRLLDILLWAGELFLLLRAPQISFTDATALAKMHGTARAASPRN
ncbi:MAG TPA: hypothetical protein VE263_04690 [Candidatus Angelobacter sp.]|nr:hypothetical protein [Candidatus Angelobacter sp.]